MIECTNQSSSICKMVIAAHDRLESGEMERWKQEMSPELFRVMFQTIAIHGPRNFGHTHAAIRLMNDSNSLLFVPDGKWKQSIRSHFAYDRNNPLEDRIIIMGDQGKMTHVRASMRENYDSIIVDGWSQISTRNRDYFYNMFAGTANVYVELQ